MSRLVAPYPDDKALWRRLLARVHPDAGGSDDLFTWATKVRESVCDCPRPVADASVSCRRGEKVTTERIPYDEQLAFVDEHTDLTRRAYSIGKRQEEPYRSILMLLIDCVSEDHGRSSLRQSRGASYRQLAYVAHMAGLTKEQRAKFYDVARSIPLSEQHAHHLIARLKERR